MSMIDIIVVLLAVVIVGYAFYRFFRKKKNSDCNCSGCSNVCPSNCKDKEKVNK